MIAPSHGVIWTEHIADILRCYSEWGSGVQDGSLVIAYDSMWGGTEKLARAIARGAANAGIVVKVFKMGATPNSTVAAELLPPPVFWQDLQRSIAACCRIWALC